MMSHAKLLCLTVAGILLVWSSVSPAPNERSYVSGNYAMTLDGKNCGFVKSVEGGVVSAEVIQEPAGSSYFVKKHIGQPKYEDFTVQVGFGMGKPLYDWIAQSWAMTPQRKNGSLITADFQLQAQSEQQFSNALITATTIPAMDTASKEPAYITIRFAPEFTRVQKASGKVEAGENYKSSQKTFVPSSFKLEIDGLDCSKVSKIESFTVKQATVTNDIGDARGYAKEPGKLEFPNLKITISEAAAQPFRDWHESFVIQGNNDEKAEKNGVLTFLSPSRQMTLARIKFFNMGIFRIQPDNSEANADLIKRLTVEMYVERMEFEYVATDSSSGSTPATTPTAPAAPAAPGKLPPMRRG